MYIGIALIALKRFEKAIKCFDRVIKLNPSKEAYLNKGISNYYKIR